MTAAGAVPLAAPPWIDTEAEQAARCARLAREVAAHDDEVRRRLRAQRWDDAIGEALRELEEAP